MQQLRIIMRNKSILCLSDPKNYICIMNTLTIHPANSDQETAICIFLDALHVEYKSVDNIDETFYLMSSPDMVKQIDKALEQEAHNEGVRITPDDV